MLIDKPPLLVTGSASSGSLTLDRYEIGRTSHGLLADGNTLSDDGGQGERAPSRYLKPEFGCLRCVRRGPGLRRGHVIYGGIFAVTAVRAAVTLQLVSRAGGGMCLVTPPGWPGGRGAKLARDPVECLSSVNRWSLGERIMGA